MCIKPKNTRKMTPDEKTVADYEDRITHLCNIASGQRVVNADLQDKLRKANETIDALRKEVTELIAKNYEISKIIAENAKLKAERDAAVEDLREALARADGSVNECIYCKYREDDGQCHHRCMFYSSECGWEWRGAQDG